MTELITFYSELFASSARLQQADEIIANEMMRNVPKSQAARVPRQVRRHVRQDQRRRDVQEVRRRDPQEPRQEPLGAARLRRQRDQKRSPALNRSYECCCSMVSSSTPRTSTSATSTYSLLSRPQSSQRSSSAKDWTSGKSCSNRWSTG